MKSKAIKIVVTATAILVVLAFSISAISQPSSTYETLTGFRFSARGDNGMTVNWYDQQTSYIVRNSKNVSGLIFDEYDISVLEYATENNYATSSISLDFDNYSQYTYDDLYSLAYAEGFVRVRWYFYLTYDSYNNQDFVIDTVGLGTDDVHSTEIIPVDYGPIGTITGAPHTTYIYQCTTEIYPEDFDDGSAHLHTRVFAHLNGSMPDSIIYGVTTKLWYTTGEFEGDQTGDYFPPGWEQIEENLNNNQQFIDDLNNARPELNQDKVNEVLGLVDIDKLSDMLKLIIHEPNATNRFYRRLVLVGSPVFISIAFVGYLLHGKKG